MGWYVAEKWMKKYTTMLESTPAMQSRCFWRSIADLVFSALTRIMMLAMKGAKKTNRA